MDKHVAVRYSEYVLCLIYFVMILFSNIGVYSIMVIHILTIPVKELHNDILNIEHTFHINFMFTIEIVSKIQ